MREMKDSGVKWVGEIPSSWKVYKVKQIANSNSEVLPENYDEEQEIDYIEIGSVTYEHGVRTTEKMKFGNAPSRARRIVHNGDTIISTVRTYLKAIAYIDDSLADKIVSTGFSVVTPHKDVVGKFLYYALSTHSFISNVEAHSVGISYPAINNSNLMNLKIVLPMQCEQIQIASYLDSKCSRIDEIIEAHQVIIEKLKEYKLSIITEAVTKGINPNVEMKESGIEWIGKIPMKWHVGKTLYALSMTITDGPHETPELFDKGIPFVSAEAVSCGNGVIDFEHIRGYISQEFYEECCKKYVPKINDIYMIKSGATTGKVAIVDTDRKFAIWSPLAVFRCDPDKMNYMYLLYFLQSDVYQKQVQDKWTYGTQQNIGMRSLEKLFVCFPSLDEQRNIADYLNEQCIRIEKNINERKLIIQKLKEYKKSLIYEVVTGKKEV